MSSRGRSPAHTVIKIPEPDRILHAGGAVVTLVEEEQHILGHRQESKNQEFTQFTVYSL